MFLKTIPCKKNMTLNLHKIAKRWQRIWKTRKIFETDPDNRPKYFITTPYPYVNCLFHIGHAYTYTRVDVYARYKRMQGYNTLFPFAFHATGAPIDTAAKKVQEGEQKQIDTLKLIGFTNEQIPAFKDPIHWIKTFSQEMEKDLKAHGMAIDWRRKFIRCLSFPGPRGRVPRPLRRTWRLIGAAAWWIGA